MTSVISHWTFEWGRVKSLPWKRILTDAMLLAAILLLTSHILITR